MHKQPLNANMLILLLNAIPCRSLADYMRSAKFEFVLKKNKAENRILNDFTLSSCKLKLTLTFKSVDKLNIATCNTFESDAGNSTKPLEAFRVL